MTKLADLAEATAIRPFQMVSVSDAQLTDLRRRINDTQWPERETVADASQGVQLATMQALAQYWATEYDYGGRADDAFDVVIPSMPGYGYSVETRERERDYTHVPAPIEPANGRVAGANVLARRPHGERCCSGHERCAISCSDAA
jgi:hypothetical protein